MRTVTIRVPLRVEYAVPVEVSEELAARLDDGDDKAFGEIEHKVKRAFDYTQHWLDDDREDADPMTWEVLSD